MDPLGYTAFRSTDPAGLHPLAFGLNYGLQTGLATSDTRLDPGKQVTSTGIHFPYGPVVPDPTRLFRETDARITLISQLATFSYPVHRRVAKHSLRFAMLQGSLPEMH